MGILNQSKAKQSGAFVSTATGVSNVDAATAISSHFVVVGSAVICFVTFTCDQTAGGPTTMRLTVPEDFGVQFANPQDVIGTMGVGDSGFSGRVEAAPGPNADEVLCLFDSGSAAIQTGSAIFSYQIP